MSAEKEMGGAEWISAAAEVLADYDATDPKALTMQALVGLFESHDVRDVLEALRDATAAAYDHVKDCDDVPTTVQSSLDEVRGHLQLALDVLGVRS